MHRRFSATVERDGRWFVASCPEVPGANGQGLTKARCLRSLTAAIGLILADRRGATGTRPRARRSHAG